MFYNTCVYIKHVHVFNIKTDELLPQTIYGNIADRFQIDETVLKKAPLDAIRCKSGVNIKKYKMSQFHKVQFICDYFAINNINYNRLTDIECISF